MNIEASAVLNFCMLLQILKYCRNSNCKNCYTNFNEDFTPEIPYMKVHENPSKGS